MYMLNAEIAQKRKPEIIDVLIPIRVAPSDTKIALKKNPVMIAAKRLTALINRTFRVNGYSSLCPDYFFETDSLRFYVVKAVGHRFHIDVFFGAFDPHRVFGVFQDERS